MLLCFTWEVSCTVVEHFRVSTMLLQYCFNLKTCWNFSLLSFNLCRSWSWRAGCIDGRICVLLTRVSRQIEQRSSPKISSPGSVHPPGYTCSRTGCVPAHRLGRPILIWCDMRLKNVDWRQSCCWNYTLNTDEWKSVHVQLCKLGVSALSMCKETASFSQFTQQKKIGVFMKIPIQYLAPTCCNLYFGRDNKLIVTLKFSLWSCISSD